MTNEIFTPEALKQQVEKLDELPKQEANVGVIATKDDVGVEGSISKELGKGTFVEADGSWMRKTGWKVAAMFGWKSKN